MLQDKKDPEETIVYRECEDDGVYFREKQKAKMINGLFIGVALIICSSTIGSCLSKIAKIKSADPIKKEAPRP